MVRLLSCSRRLAAALLTAGLLGTASPSSAAPVVESKTHVVSVGRGAEMQAELAWMSDPDLFRCPIRARSTAKGIEAAGFVPLPQLRARAVKLAGSACGAAVKDSMTVAKVGGCATTRVDKEELIESVVRTVKDVLGAQSRGIVVSVGEDGRVMLRGSVPSLEDKHAVSVRMRLVKGCACVVNQMDVGPRTVAAVTPVAVEQPEKAKPKPLPVIQTKTPTTTAKVKEPTPPKTSQPEPTIQRTAAWTEPADGPSLGEPSGPAEKKPTGVSRAQFVSPYGGSGFASQRPATTPTTTTTTTTTPSTFSAMPVGELMPKAMPKPTAVPIKTEGSGFGTPVAEPLEPIEESRSVTTERMPIAHSRPASRVVVTSRQPTPVMEAPAPAPRSPGLLSSLFRREAKPLPAQTTSRNKVSDRAYVTTGTVIFHDDSEKPTTVKPEAAQLRGKLVALCGDDVKEVRVETKAKGGLKVVICVASVEQIDAMTKKLLHEPEMHDLQVDLSFEIRP